MKKDAYYFPHDANARNDPKIHGLIKRHGFKGYGWYWVIIENLRESKNYEMQDEIYVWDSIQNQLSCDDNEIKSFKKDLIELKLIEIKNKHFYSISLKNRMKSYDEKKEKYTNAAKKMLVKAGNTILASLIDSKTNLSGLGIIRLVSMVPGSDFIRSSSHSSMLPPIVVLRVWLNFSSIGPKSVWATV